jgi:hypothetical protein
LFLNGSVVVAVFALAGCGSTSDAPSGNVDSGIVTDGTAPSNDGSLPSSDAAGDTGVPSGDAGDAGCTFGDADLFASSPADAALNDAGASVGTCLACAQTKCKSQVTGCDDDACCESTFDCVFNCMSGVGESLLNCYTVGCGGSLSTSNIDVSEGLLAECAIKQCPTECAVCSLSPKLCPTDAGPTPPVDSGSDASDDGATDAADASED